MNGNCIRLLDLLWLFGLGYRIERAEQVTDRKFKGGSHVNVC
jgi:hypothetical protein